MANFTDLKTKTARIAHIKNMLANNDQWALRGLVRIFENQTDDEQNSEQTRHHNNIGFSGADAEILSSMAKQVIAGRTMSVKQMAIIHRKMPKYARQLEEVSNKPHRPDQTEMMRDSREEEGSMLLREQAM